jgi:hypothetical protein
LFFRIFGRWQTPFFIHDDKEMSQHNVSGHASPKSSSSCYAHALLSPSLLFSLSPSFTLALALALQNPGAPPVLALPCLGDSQQQEPIVDSPVQKSF